MRIRIITLACAVAAPLWMGCTTDDNGGETPAELQPITAEAVPQTSANNVESMVDGAADAMAFVEDTDFMETITDMLGGGEEDDCFMWDEMTGEEIPCDDEGDEDDGSMAEGLSEMAKDVAEWLKEDILVDGVQSEDGLTVTYNVSPDVICDVMEGESDEGDMGEPAMMPEDMREGEPGDDFEEMDPEDMEDEDDGKSCHEVFTEEPVALSVTSTGEGEIDLAVLMGQDKLSPIRFFFHATKLGVEVDLGVTLDVLAVYAAAIGEDAPELPVTLSGAVAATLTKDADKVYTIGASITQKIAVNGTMDDASYSLSIDKSDPVVGLTMDGVNESMTASANVGAIDISVPASWLDDGCESDDAVLVSTSEPMWDEDSEGGDDEGWMDPEDNEMWEDPCAEEEPVAGTYEAHLGGLSASVTMDGETEAITVNNMSLGDTTTTVSRNGDTLIGVDMNADHGRAMDLTVTSEENAMSLQVDPAMVLSLAFSLADADGMFEGAPWWLHDEVISVSLAGADRPEVRLDFGDEEADEEGGFSVVAGTLTLSSTSLEEDVVVEAGMCLVGAEGEEGEVMDMGMPGEPGDDGDWEEEEEEETHLFAELQAGSCE